MADALRPSFQVTVSAFRPCIAAQVSSATTATPFEIRTTCLTPGTSLAFESSTLASAPPKTGQRSTTAYRISGRRMSMPNFVLPSTLPGVSSRFGDVPIRRNCFGFFNAGAAGAGSFAAAAASDPKLARAPAFGPRTKPFSAWQAEGLTPQCSAAAAMSISRAVAPARRSGSHEDRMLALP